MEALPRALLLGMEDVCVWARVCMRVGTCQLSLCVCVSSWISLGPGIHSFIPLFVEPQLSARPGAECWEYGGKPHACGSTFMELTVPWEKEDVY